MLDVSKEIRITKIESVRIHFSFNKTSLYSLWLILATRQKLKKKIICTKFQIKHPHYNEVEQWHNDNFGMAVLPKSLVNEEAETKFCFISKIGCNIREKKP